MKICNKCVLPDTFPGIKFNAEGLCQYCLEIDQINFDEVRTKVEDFLNELSKEDCQYHVALAFSGGKDSTYTLKYLVEKFNLRIMAITIDNGFISERAYENCRLMTSELGVDHIFLKPNPKSMKNVYRKSLKEDIHSGTSILRASQVCNSCIQIINTQLVNFCTNFSVPVLAGGYIGGQVPSKTGFMKTSPAATERIRASFLKKIDEVFQNGDSTRLFKYFGKSDASVTILNPMVYLRKSEESILEEIKTIGWILPDNTGNSSTNCLLNDYAIKDHLKRYQFHPYVFEIATSVRSGSMTRKEALEKLEVDLPAEYVKSIESQLSLK